MAHNFFLSHFGEDKEVAEVIATTLNRISLRQIVPWYSSDSSETGGLKPGNIWFNEIVSKITQSKALVAVLTPNSIARPWIYFESGIAQSLNECEIIPVCIGIKRDSISAPLGMYQCYQLTDYKSLKEFISKLLNKFNISFDEEMAKPVLEKAISTLSKITFLETKVEEDVNQNFIQAISELKNHIDKRFIDLLDREYSTNTSNHDDKTIIETSDLIIFTITISIKFPEYSGKQFIEIRSDATVQEVLDGMFFLVQDYVDAFTYMEEWVLRNPKTGQRMILREIGNMVPAKFIFKPEIEWEAIKLKTEYKASSSKEIVKANR